MANPTYTSKKAIVPTPATASAELHATIVKKLTAHYEPILTPQVMISNRKGCYATVINSHYDGVALEQVIGTDNAKVATEQVLTALTVKYSSISSK